MDDAALARFVRRLRTAGRCVEWAGARTSHGYGNFWLDGRARLAHVAAWEHFHRCRLPKRRGRRRVLDHLCRNRRCVRVDHLELVTVRKNTVRGIRARRERGEARVAGGQ